MYPTVFSSINTPQLICHIYKQKFCIHGELDWRKSATTGRGHWFGPAELGVLERFFRRLTSRPSLGHQVGRRVFWEGPNFFKLCPTHFSKGGEKNFSGSSPPWIRVPANIAVCSWASEGEQSPWILKISAKKVAFLVSSGKKQISLLLAPTRKILENPLVATTWKKFFRRPSMCFFYLFELDAGVGCAYQLGHGWPQRNNKRSIRFTSAECVWLEPCCVD